MIKKFLPIALLLLAAACGGRKSEENASKKPLVWVSIAPYQQMAQRIAGPEIEVQTIVPQGANPHSFEPTSRQAARMGDGAVWFRIGEPFEQKLLGLLKTRNPNLKVLDLRDKIEMIAETEHECEHCSMDHQDRHIWMSPKDAQTQAKEMALALEEAFPDKKEAMEKNLETLVADLQELDEEIQARLKPVENKVILVSHPAFGYFCRDYDCVQLSVEYEGKDPRPKHIEGILRQAIAQKAEVAIALPQYNNKGAQLIAEKLHVPVRMIDPYSPDYFKTMRQMAELIADPNEQP
ncbi:MAG: zinc ABC transporter substrate-binding protein [Verrucomicrobia bacterium]|nr:zinc ABC transporter substrate-binding protein [Verrucomicrobiota bacterium]